VSVIVLYKHKIFSVTYAGVPARLEFWGSGNLLKIVGYIAI